MAFFTTDLYTTNGVACAEGYTGDAAGLSRIIEESAADQLEIVKAMHRYDMLELRGAYRVRSIREASGDEDDIEDVDDELETAKEASIKEIFKMIKEKIKAFFAKIFGFIRDLFNKLVTFKKNNQKFYVKYAPIVDEYKEYINKYEYEGGYVYNATKIDTLIAAAAEDQNKMVDETIEIVDKDIAAYGHYDDYKNLTSAERDDIKRGGAKIHKYDALNKLTTADILSKMRGEPKKQTFTGSDIVNILAILNKIDIKSIEKSEKAAKTSLAKLTSHVAAAEAEYNKLPEDAPNRSKIIKSAQNSVKMGTDIQQYTLRNLSAGRTALVDYSNQIKHVVIGALAQAKKNKAEANKK